MNSLGRVPHRAARAPLLVVALLSITALSCASAPKPPAGGIPKGDTTYLVARMTHDIQEAMKKTGAASFAIAVVDAEKVLWEAAFGFADKDRAGAAELTSMYRMGSVSKVLTATRVMQLVDEGKIDLDAPLSTYIPEFIVQRPAFVDEGAWSKEQITTRTILTHHSGLPGDLYHRMISKKPYAQKDYVALLRDEHAASTVKHAHAYSNVAITLLGVLIERVSGEPFVKSMRDHVLRPSGMQTADFEFTDAMKPTQTYAHKGGRVVDDAPIGQMAAGSLYASVRDMTAFMQTMLRRGRGVKDRVISEDRLREMWTRQNADVALDLDLEMGLAWFLSREDAPGSGQKVEHDGATLFHRSAMKLLPDHGLGVVVVTNSEEGQTNQLAEDALFIALETMTGIKRPEPPPPPAHDETAFTKEELDALAGAYDTPFGFMRLARDDDALTAKALGETFVFRPTKGKRFDVAVLLFGLFALQPDELARLSISFDEVAGQKVIVEHEGSKRALLGARIEPPAIDDVWRARLGDYTIVNGQDDILLFDRFALKDDGGALVFAAGPVSQPLMLPWALAPVDEDRAVVMGIGRSRGESVSAIEHEGKPALRWSGYVLVKKGP